MLKQKKNATADLNPQETSEWLEALEQVIDEEGPDRASYLLQQLLNALAHSALRAPPKSTTPYLNTIPRARGSALSGRPCARTPHQKPDPLECGGDGRAGKQVRSQYRRPHLHLCLARHTQPKSASIIFSAAAIGDQPGDFIYLQGHASPGVYSRAFLEGRLTEEHLKNFRHELRDIPGCPLIRTPG